VVVTIITTFVIIWDSLFVLLFSLLFSFFGFFLSFFFAFFFAISTSTLRKFYFVVVVVIIIIIIIIIIIYRHHCHQRRHQPGRFFSALLGLLGLLGLSAVPTAAPASTLPSSDTSLKFAFSSPAPSRASFASRRRRDARGLISQPQYKSISISLRASRGGKNWREEFFLSAFLKNTLWTQTRGKMSLASLFVRVDHTAPVRSLIDRMHSHAAICCRYAVDTLSIRCRSLRSVHSLSHAPELACNLLCSLFLRQQCCARL
jgi:hypothetical protein